LDTVEPSAVDELPERKGKAPHPGTYAALDATLKQAQIFNLSGIRVLDRDGCAVASTRGQLDRCFGELPEVRAALAGEASSLLRDRISDEPSPPLYSMRRRGDLRVFVALPVWNEGSVIGAVLLSRTAESGLEWLFKHRRDLFFAGIFVAALGVLISLLFSSFITRPLSRMAKRLERVADTPQAGKLGEIPAPIEIHTLGVALDERARRLEDKSRYVAEFAANVSHELKTPLTSIRGAVELLKDSESDMSVEQRRRFLDNIEAAVLRTERLVTRLLELARLEAGDVGDDAATPCVPIAEFFEHFQDRHGEAVQVEPLSSLSGALPSIELESVVNNLVDNALRYRTTEPVRVRVSVEGEPKMLHLSVHDDGPGISEDNRKHLFERFFTTERDRGGTGLGLAIVHAIAERRGGRASLKSGPGGTVAEVWLGLRGQSPKTETRLAEPAFSEPAFSEQGNAGTPSSHTRR
jgi:signal transduction histidine kinase